MSMTSNSHLPEQIEITTSFQRRRRWTTQEKLEIVEESELSGMSVLAVARKHDVSPSLLFTWRRLALRLPYGFPPGQALTKEEKS